MTLGNTIKAARIHQGLTENDLGALSGVSGSYIVKLESNDGVRPSYKRILEISKHIGLEVLLIPEGDVIIKSKSHASGDRDVMIIHSYI